MLSYICSSFSCSSSSDSSSCSPFWSPFLRAGRGGGGGALKDLFSFFGFFLCLFPSFASWGYQEAPNWIASPSTSFQMISLTLRKCPSSLRDSSRIFPIGWEYSGILPRFCENISWILDRFFLDSSRILPGFFQNYFGILPGFFPCVREYFLNTCRILLIFMKMCPGFFRDLFRIFQTFPLVWILQWSFKRFVWTKKLWLVGGSFQGFG